MYTVQGGSKLAHFLVLLVTSSNIDQFSNYFTVGIRTFVIILSLKIPPHLNCVVTLYLVKCQCLKATIENKTSVTKHFKKLSTENVFIVSVIV